MHKPALLLFDLGGVLIENTVFDNLQRLLPQPHTHAMLKERWLASGAVRSFELGQIDAESFARRFIAEWQIALEPAAFLEAFAGWPKGYYAGARELLQSLRRSYRIGCLSNSNAVHWQRLGGFEGEFDVVMSSHLLGQIKPDLAAFTLALERCGAAAHEVIFFDDSPPNIQAAQSLGIHSVYVDGFDDLRLALEAHGLTA